MDIASPSRPATKGSAAAEESAALGAVVATALAAADVDSSGWLAVIFSSSTEAFATSWGVPMPTSDISDPGRTADSSANSLSSAFSHSNALPSSNASSTLSRSLYTVPSSDRFSKPTPSVKLLEITEALMRRLYTHKVYERRTQRNK